MRGVEAHDKASAPIDCSWLFWTWLEVFSFSSSPPSARGESVACVLRFDLRCGVKHADELRERGLTRSSAIHVSAVAVEELSLRAAIARAPLRLCGRVCDDDAERGACRRESARRCEALLLLER